MPQIEAQALSALKLQIKEELRLERTAFGAKSRAARAVLGFSQDEFGELVGLTQRSVHRIEQGLVEPRLSTIAILERFWNDHGIAFEGLPDGGFRLVVRGSLLRGQ